MLHSYHDLEMASKNIVVKLIRTLFDNPIFSDQPYSNPYLLSKQHTQTYSETTFVEIMKQLTKTMD